MAQGPGAGASAEEQEKWLLSGWERSQYDDGPRESLGVIVNIDRVVVVTGVSSGIGHGIATALVSHQCHVFGSVRSEADAKRLQAEFGDFFTPLIMDITDEAAVRRAAAEVKGLMKGRTLMGLVNNAGISIGMEALADVPLEKFRQQLEVNVVGQVSVTQAFLPLLGTDLSLSGPPGKILNMSSIYASYTLPFACAYSASKAGLEAISEGLRRELMPFGIDVVIIAPGPIETEIWTRGLATAEGNVKGGGSVWDAPLQRAAAAAVKLTSRPSFYLPASAVGEKVWKVLNTKRPAVRCVITGNWFINWFVPVYFPKRLVDKEVARRFKLNRPIQRGERAKAE